MAFYRDWLQEALHTAESFHISKRCNVNGKLPEEGLVGGSVCSLHNIP